MLSHLISQNLLLEVLLEVMIFDLVRTIFPARNPVRARFCQMLEITGVWLHLTTFALISCIACITRNLVHACTRLGRLVLFALDLRRCVRTARCPLHDLYLISATCPFGIWLKHSHFSGRVAPASAVERVLPHCPIGANPRACHHRKESAAPSLGYRLESSIRRDVTLIPELPPTSWQ